MSKQAPPPNSALHLLCRTICVATAYSCVRLLPDSPLVVIRQILSCTTVLHVHPWRSPTTPSSVASSGGVGAYSVVASRRTSNSARPTSRVCWASLAALFICGAFPISQKHVSLNTSRVYLVTLSDTPPPHVWLWQTPKRDVLGRACALEMQGLRP